jgi:hypothetical protein
VKIKFPPHIGNVNFNGLPGNSPGAVENDDNGGKIFSMAKRREDFRLATGEAIFRSKG